jgi:signal transduction histidine kinase
LLVLCLGGVLGSDDLRPKPLLVVLTVVQVGLLVWRRRSPLLVGCLSTLTYAALNGVAQGPYPPDLAVFPAVVAVYTVGAHCTGRRLLVGGLVTFVTVDTAWVLTPEGDLADFLPWAVWGTAFGVGRLVQRRAAAVAALAAQNALLEQRRSDDALDVAARERDRIARELHDVVALAVSVMVVQSGAEGLSLRGGSTDVSRTSEVLAQIERSGREALDELRTMLGVLRRRDEDDEHSREALRPQPGLDQVEALVARVRESGVPASLVITGEPRVVSGAVALSAYRIVQESLTNVVKHAGAVPTQVLLDYAPSDLRVNVTNAEGARRTTTPVAGGHGLIGMRERAVAVGGELVAQPTGDGGWHVEATLPYSPTAVRATS